MTDSERSTKKHRAARWSAASAREVLERWRSSGKSAAVFAAEQGVSANRLSYWAKQLADAKPQSPQFVAVSLPIRDATRARAAIEIDLGGVTVRVFDGADTSLVAGIVCALQAHGAQRC
jgi:hypothetical protein